MESGASLSGVLTFVWFSEVLSGVPHSIQNFACSGAAAEQARQVRGRPLPQFMQ
jgi:hypothetical protein